MGGGIIYVYMEGITHQWRNVESLFSRQNVHMYFQKRRNDYILGFLASEFRVEKCKKLEERKMLL